jgi:hypothetical protein
MACTSGWTIFSNRPAGFSSATDNAAHKKTTQQLKLNVMSFIIFSIGAQ